MASIRQQMLEKIRVALFAVIFMTAALPCVAQESKYKFDFGGSIGMSGYIGDANPSNIFAHPGVAVEANARYLHNTRLSLRGILGFQTLSGNTANLENKLPDGVVYSFKSQSVTLDVRGEFNFLPYGIGATYKSLRRCTPYLTLGLGLDLAFSGGNTAFAPTLPMGAGVKYKLNERLNLGAEFTMTKVFGDKVDGSQLTDLTGIKTSFIKNTDWISRITIGISYEFGERCETCHYVE